MTSHPVRDRRVMITVAPTGARLSTEDHPAVPMTPGEIAAAVIESAGAGAALAHVHARDERGRETHDPVTLHEIRERISAESDIVVQFSTGGRGADLEQVRESMHLAPESASFPLRQVYGPEAARYLDILESILQNGTLPDFTVHSAEDVIRVSELGTELNFAPVLYTVAVRQPGSYAQAVRCLMDIAAALPSAASWCLAKGSPYYLELRATAIGLGGHVRCGFEDATVDATKRYYGSNTAAVTEVARLVRALGREPMSPAEARALLSLVPARGEVR